MDEFAPQLTVLQRVRSLLKGGARTRYQIAAELSDQKRCVSCHGQTLAGQDQIPRIGKQRIDYLVKSLTELRDGTRPGADTIMSGAVAGLSDADLLALAHFSASK